MDQHVPIQITAGLRERGVDVLTAFEDDSSRLPDPELLQRAADLARVLFTQDRHFLAEASLRQREGRVFAGIVYAHQLGPTIGQCIDDLELIAKAGTTEDTANRVIYLPL